METKVKRESFQLENDADDIIYGDLRYSAEAENKQPVVVISHGFKAWKDWGFFPYLAEKIAESGAISIVFNFSLDGAEDDKNAIRNVEKFAKNTVSRELKDLNSILNSISENRLFHNIKRLWNGEIFLLGHSRGSALSILAAEDNFNIKKLALWSPVAKLDRYTTRQKKIWEEKGFLALTDSSTGKKLRIDYSYIEDLERNKERFDLLDAVSKLTIPMLLISGEQDLTTKTKEAEELLSANPEYARLETIEKTGHTFGVQDSFERPNESLNKAINLTLRIFGLIN